MALSMPHKPDRNVSHADRRAQSNPRMFGKEHGRDEMDVPWQYAARYHILPWVLRGCDSIFSMLQKSQAAIGILTSL